MALHRIQGKKDNMSSKSGTWWSVMKSEEPTLAKLEAGHCVVKQNVYLLLK
jgi:hypothetical protein